MKGPNFPRLKEAWMLCFILGIIMLNYPFIHIFNKESMIFGLPALVLYFLLGWPASILVIYLFAKSLGGESAMNDSDTGKDKGKDQG